MFKNMNVLVTGANGFVGVNLLQRLLKLGANITATIHNTAPIIKDDCITYIQCDLQKPEDCKKVVQGIDFVFMCAAKTSGAAGMENDPLVHFTPNVIMNLLMLKAAYEANVQKFLFLSSSTVYPLTDYPVHEDDVTNEFYDKYFVEAWAKRFSEIACEMYATRTNAAMKLVVLRPANLYGEHDNFEWETSHVIPALIRKVVERHDPIEVWGDGNDIKEFIYINDFIDGMLLAMEKLNWFDPINIAAGKPYTIKEVLNTIIETDNYEGVELVFNKTKPTMIPKRMMNIYKAKSQLDFEAKTTLKEGIQKTIEWYRLFRENKKEK